MFTTHSEWELLSAKQISSFEHQAFNAEPFSVLTLEIKIRRRPLFYIIHLIVPMVLVALLSLLSFAIPSKSGNIISLHGNIRKVLFMAVWRKKK